MNTATPEIERFAAEWAHLSSLTSSAAPGWTRTGFSDEDRAARDWLRNLMREAGLETRQDSVGNVIGRLEGDSPSAPDIVIGSHSDTVPGGGRFDGIVGVLGAIEVARMLRREGRRLRHGLRVVDFSNEEGNPQGVKLVGSRAVSGTLDRAALESRDLHGVSLGELIDSSGLRSADAHRAQWRSADIGAYIELHIEQGPVLEQRGAAIGIVSEICGISTFSLEIAGRRDHAGTMPMNVRQDAMCCAADAVLAVQRVGSGGEGAVGTVGEITTPSPLTNTISEAASVTGEFRSPDLSALQAMQIAFESEITRIDLRHRTTSRVNWGHLDAPTPMNDRLSQVAAAVAAARGYNTLRLYSGATHDGVALSSLAPTAMIFIPSRDGRSHCPEEWSDLDNISAGIDVLHSTVVRLDDLLAHS